MHKAKSAYTGLHAYSNGFTQTCHFKKIKQFKKREKKGPYRGFTPSSQQN